MIQNIKYLVKQTLIYGLGGLSTKLVGFILLPLYTNQLNVSQYGILGIFDLILQLYLSVFSLGLMSSLVRWFSLEKAEPVKQKKLISFTFFFLFIFNLLLVSVFMLV